MVYFPIPQVFSVVCIIVSFDSSFFEIHLKKLKYKLKHHDLCQTRARLSDQGLTALRVTSMVFNHKKKKQQCNIWLKVTFSSSDEISELFSLLSSVSDSEDDFSSLSLASLSSSLSPDKKKHAKIKYFQSLFFRVFRSMLQVIWCLICGICRREALLRGGRGVWVSHILSIFGLNILYPFIPVDGFPIISVWYPGISNVNIPYTI